MAANQAPCPTSSWMTRRRWLGAAGALGSAPALANTYIVYDDKQYDPRQIQSVAANPVQVPFAVRLANGDYSVPVSQDGHYYIGGFVNGFPTVFMVDTGARMTAVPVNLARNAGIRAGKAVEMSTAGGKDQGGLSSGNTVGVGPFTATDVPIIVMKRLDVSLLGAEVLNRFQITYANGTMTMRAGQQARR